MDQIRQQVRRAQRRLVLQQFLGILGWSMFAGLLVAAVGLAIPKRWVLNVESDVWMWSCVAGGIVSGLAVAILATLCVRRGMLDAAIELDRRFALKERVSTTLALSPEEAQSDIGQALITDTVRRVETIDVREHFLVRAPWTIGLPVLPALLVFVLAVFVPDAARQKKANANATTAKAIVRKETEKLKQDLKKKRAELDQENLKEAEELLTQLEKAVDELQSKDDIDRKKAMIKINEMAKMVEQKREKMSGSEEIRKQFEKLKDIQQGPGEKIAEAMKQGNFEQAKKELEKLQDKVSKGDLSEEEKKQLSEQLSQMKQQMQQAKEDFEQAKRDLQEQIAQKTREGDLAGANDLQNKLDKLNQMSQKMDQLDKMAQSMGQCSEALQNGDGQKAAAELDKLAESLQQMQNDLDQLETLNEMLDELSAAKDALGERSGDGDMQGNANMFAGMGSRSSGGRGMGQGQGSGERPEDATDTQNYESKVGAQLHKGESIATGVAAGPNVAGDSRESVKEAILRSMSEKSDPLADQTLPRDQRDHAKEYFQKFLPGSGD